MLSQKLNNMKKSTAAVLAALLIAACAGDVYMTHQAEIKAMQDEGVKSLAAVVDLNDYREAEKEEIGGILDSTEAAIRESEDQAEVDQLIADAGKEIEKIKTDAELSKEEGAEKLKASVDLSLYREAEQTETEKILKETNKKINKAEDPAEIDSMIEEASSKIAEFKTDEEYTAEEEAARAAAAAAANKQKSKKKSSGSQGCVGKDADLFY